MPRPINTLQDNLYGTSVKAVREPGLAGRVVVLDTQLKAVNLLQSFADIHPVVIFVDPESPESLAAVLQEPLRDDVLQQTFKALKAQAKDNEHIFTHVVPLSGTFDETLQRLVETYKATMASEYWVNTFQPLPTNTPEALRLEAMANEAASTLTALVLAAAAGELVEAPKLAEQTQVRDDLVLTSNAQQLQAKAAATEAIAPQSVQVELAAIVAELEQPVAQSPPQTESQPQVAQVAFAPIVSEAEAEPQMVEPAAQAAADATQRESLKIHPHVVVVHRNQQNSFGFSVLGGVENDSLPTIKLRPDAQLNMFVNKRRTLQQRPFMRFSVSGGPLRDNDEILTINDANVAGEPHDVVCLRASVWPTLTVVAGRGHDCRVAY